MLTDAGEGILRRNLYPVHSGLRPSICRKNALGLRPGLPMPNQVKDFAIESMIVLIDLSCRVIGGISRSIFSSW